MATPSPQYWSEFGNPNGSPVVFVNGLGMEAKVWTGVIQALDSAQDCRLITYDLFGQGAREELPNRGSMGAFIRDTECLMDDLALRDAVIVGIGFGGMIAQGLAVKRLDLIRGLVLVNTAAKLGTKPHWEAQIDHLKRRGFRDFNQSIWEGWFSKKARSSGRMEPWRQMLETAHPLGIVRGIEALSGTDFYTPISGLKLPTLGISAYNDLLFPPDLMRETVEIIPGSEFQIMPRVGHLAMVEAPEDFAPRLEAFLMRIGHHRPQVV